MHNNSRDTARRPVSVAAGPAPDGDEGRPPGLLETLRRTLRAGHYSLSTEQQYVQWVRDFVRYHGMRHPREMGAAQVQDYLTHLAADRGVAPATHRQALSALLLLYRRVLGINMPWLDEIGRPRIKRRLPVVLAVDEVLALLRAFGANDEPAMQLVAQLLYGTGMRIAEALRLRVKDIDFAHRTIIVREGKGGKDRALMLPDTVREPLRAQLARTHALWERDRAAQRAGVWMPDALARKYPRAGQSWAWHWVFAQATLSRDPRSGLERRHHMFDQRFQRAFRKAVAASGVSPQATPHTLRHYVARQTMSTRVAFYLRQLPIIEGHSPLATTARSRTRAACRPADTDRPWRRAVSSSRAPSPSVRGWPPGTSASSRSTRVPATAR
jgi:integron integrase